MRAMDPLTMFKLTGLINGEWSDEEKLRQAELQLVEMQHHLPAALAAVREARVDLVRRQLREEPLSE